MDANANVKVSKEETKTPEAQNVDVIVTGCIRLNVRTSPTMSSSVLCVISKGDMVKVDKNNLKNPWSFITLPDGKRGYVMSKYIRLA